MPITTADLANKKAYENALLKTIKSAGKGNFLFYEGKYADGNKARLLVFGPNLPDLKKHLEAAKATLIDEGRIDSGPVFAAKRGKLDAKALAALGIGDVARIAGDDDANAKPSFDVNTIVPVLAKPVRIVLADVISRQKVVATLQHPVLKAALEKKADDLVEALKKGELAGFHKAHGAFVQDMSDAQLAPVIAKELARIEPVAQAHPKQDAKDTYADAKQSFDRGDLLRCRALISNFTGKYGHSPYEAQAQGEEKESAEFVAKAGTLADGYEKAKKELEVKIDKVLADKKKFSTYADEAGALKTFFAKSATLGLRQQVKAVQAETDPAKRKSKIEKAILSVQEYITQASRVVPGPMLSIDYFRILRHMHAELTKMHH